MSNRAQVAAYLKSKGVAPVKIAGILANIEDESGFQPAINEGNPTVPGSRGGYGLFQHTGPRRRALEAYAGDGVSDWRKQIDFAMTEPDMANYLKGSYASPGEAAVGFLDKFERPAKKHRDARAAKYLGSTFPMPDVRMASNYGGMTTGSTNPMDIPGDPRTGRMNMPMNPYAPMPVAPGQTLMPQMPGQPQQQGFGGLMANPLFQMGAAIAANPSGYGGSALQGLGAAVGAQQKYQLMAQNAAMQQQRLAMSLTDLEDKRADRQQRRELVSRLKRGGRTAEADAIAAGADPSDVLMPKAPRTETFFEGDEAVQKQWDPTTQSWNTVGTGPRWKPDAPEGEDSTASMRNYEYLVEQGVDPQKARDMTFKSGTTVNIGSTPQGARPVTDPDTGEVTGYQPLPGSPQYQKIQDEAQRISQGVNSVTELRSLIDKHGTEATPFSSGKVRGKMSDLYGRIVAAIAASRGMGVLQEGERQAVEAQYPDPSKIGSLTKSDERMMAAYESLLEELQTSLAAKESQMGGGAGTVGPQLGDKDVPYGESTEWESF